MNKSEQPRKRLGPTLWLPLCCALALPLMTWSGSGTAASSATSPKSAAPAANPTVSAPLARRARAVVEAQLAAFAADDAALAFSFASPGIRKVFEGPDQFMAMVKAHYPVVRRPGSVAFLKAVWIDGELTQGVQLSDESGAVWYAVYHLEQQRDKSWRIAGCDVFPSQGKMV